MKFKLDISTDFTKVCNDFHGSATLKTDGSADITLADCVLGEPVEWKELEPTGAQVLRRGTLFVWPKSRSALPAVGSVVVDEEGVFWTVWKSLYKQHVETWEVTCLNLNIVTANANQATVLKGWYGKGNANEARATWRGLWSGRVGGGAQDRIPARFQPSMETALLEFGAEFSEQVYRVYFDRPLPIEVAGGEYRLVDTEGHRFRVVKYHQEDRIDRLPVAIAVKITEGAEYAGGDGP